MARYIIQKFMLNIARNTGTGEIVQLSDISGRMDETIPGTGDPEHGLTDAPRYRIGEYMDMMKNGSPLEYYELNDAQKVVEIFRAEHDKEDNGYSHIYRIVKYEGWC